MVKDESVCTIVDGKFRGEAVDPLVLLEPPYMWGRIRTQLQDNKQPLGFLSRPKEEQIPGKLDSSTVGSAGLFIVSHTCVENDASGSISYPH